MKIFNCIIGVLSILSSVYCIFYPGITFLSSGLLVTIILGAWGIGAIINYVVNKSEKQKSDAAMGALGLVAGIAAAVFSLIAIFTPAIRLILDIIILCIFAGWLIVDGIKSIAMSFNIKKEGSKSWILSLILGVIVLLAGIIGFFNLIFLAQTIGMLIGILLMTYGIKLILSVFEKN